MGRISLLVLDSLVPDGITITIPEHGESFEISQTIDGDIFVENYPVEINDQHHFFYTRLNSKEPYPVFIETTDDGHIDVLKEDGYFTQEFKDYFLEARTNTADIQNPH